jgi:hypothetical protein
LDESYAIPATGDKRESAHRRTFPPDHLTE